MCDIMTRTYSMNWILWQLVFLFDEEKILALKEAYMLDSVSQIIISWENIWLKYSPYIWNTR